MNAWVCEMRDVLWLDGLCMMNWISVSGNPVCYGIAGHPKWMPIKTTDSNFMRRDPEI